MKTADVVATITTASPVGGDHGILVRVSLFIEGYIIPILLVLGVCGNTLTIVIFVRTRQRQDAPIQYLSCLAFADTGVIFTLGLVHWLVEGLRYVTNGNISIHIATFSPAICKSWGLLLHVFECISAWMIVSFSVERAYVVNFPLQRAIITSEKRTLVIGGIIIFCFLASVHKIPLYEVYYIATFPACFYPVSGPKSALGRFLFFQYDTTVHNYIPCSLIVVANVAIFVGINRANRQIKEKAFTKRMEQDRRIMMSLMLVSMLYIIFMMPASVSFSYMLYLLTKEGVDETYIRFVTYVMIFFDQFSMLNFCLNFVIYGCTLPFYREATVHMFASKCSKGIKTARSGKTQNNLQRVQS